MGYFKNLISKKKSSESLYSEAIDKLLESVDFYEDGIPQDFYMKLLEIYKLKYFNKEDPKEYRAYNEFKEQVDLLSQPFNKILQSSFNKEAMKNYVDKFEESISKDFEFPGVKIVLSSFWYQPIRKTREDIKKSNEKEIINSFEEFHSKIRIIMERIMQLR